MAKKAEAKTILEILKERFHQNMQRHPNSSWASVEKKLQTNSKKLATIQKMEDTGGEPDVIGYDEKIDLFIFCDCSAESPTGRRNLCYDSAALEARKEFKPKGDVVDTANEIGMKLLNEEEYFALQKLGAFDTKTSSWLLTPDSIRKLGGAIFGDFRYGRTFIYHNGASSYYAARGFRGLVAI